MQLFVSYSRQDHAAVRELVADLELAHFTVWHDQELRGGDPWWQDILQRIRACDVFLFVLSQHSLRSKPCSAELSYARALGLPVIPVQVGPVENIRTTAVADIQVLDRREPTVANRLALIAAIHEHGRQRGPLIDPLPDPPPVPFAYLLRLGAAINAEQLNPDQQGELIRRLRECLETEDDDGVRDDARDLLRALRRRVDVTFRHVAEIDRMLAEDAARGAEGGPMGERDQQVGTTSSELPAPTVPDPALTDPGPRTAPSRSLAPPPAEQVALPPPDPPPPGGGDRSSFDAGSAEHLSGSGGPPPRRRRTTVIVAAVALSVCVVAAVLAVALATRSDPPPRSASSATAIPSSQDRSTAPSTTRPSTVSPSTRPSTRPSTTASTTAGTTAPSTTPPTTAGQPATPTSATPDLLAILPADLSGCYASQTGTSGAIASAQCGPSASQPGPSSAWFNQFPAGTDMNEVFFRGIANSGLSERPPDQGCPTAPGYYTWVYRGSTAPAGYLGCGVDSNDQQVWVYWVDYQHRVETGITAPGTDQADLAQLYAWWQNRGVLG